MIKTTTYSDLINYAYNEHGLIDGDRTQRAIDGDPNLKSEYDESTGQMHTKDPSVLLKIGGNKKADLSMTSRLFCSL